MVLQIQSYTGMSTYSNLLYYFALKNTVNFIHYARKWKALLVISWTTFLVYEILISSQSPIYM